MRFTFDIAINEPDTSFEVEMGKLVAQGLGVRVLTMEGPGGGWPEIEVHGEFEDVTAVMGPLGFDRDDVIAAAAAGEGMDESDLRSLMDFGGFMRECVHCLHRDLIMPGPIGIFGSAAEFCTRCESPWKDPSICCEHCGTGAKLDFEDLIVAKVFDKGA